jgi:hypothetical protein
MVPPVETSWTLVAPWAAFAPTVHVAGIRIDPDGARMMQAARNLLDPVDGFLRNATHLIHDRDPLFTAPSALLAGARTVYLCEKLQQAGPFHPGSRRHGGRCSNPDE